MIFEINLLMKSGNQTVTISSEIKPAQAFHMYRFILKSFIHMSINTLSIYMLEQTLPSGPLGVFEQSV